MNAYLLIIALIAPVVFLVCIVLFIIGILRLQTTVDRMEAATKQVAVGLLATARDLQVAAQQRVSMGLSLDRIEAGDLVVADNLASSVHRADATVGPDGAAADAALRTGDTAEAIHRRQDAENEKTTS